MLLLGVTLTVGFYEGRRLVQDTVRALSVAAGEAPGQVVAASAPAVRVGGHEMPPAVEPAVEAAPAGEAAASRKKRSRRRQRAERRLADAPEQPVEEVGGPGDVDFAVDAERLMDANRLDLRMLRRRARMVRRAEAAALEETEGEADGDL
jgi:hypothetical protein